MENLIKKLWINIETEEIPWEEYKTWNCGFIDKREKDIKHFRYKWGKGKDNEIYKQIGWNEALLAIKKEILKSKIQEETVD